MMKFKTVFTAHDSHTVKSVSGERDRPTYKPKFNDSGAYELVQDGFLHSYDDVQAYAPQTDMRTIIQRYIKTGEEKLIQRRAAFYADVTTFPKDYASLHNALSDADAVFNALPAEVKASFGNNAAAFYADEKKAFNAIAAFKARAVRSSGVKGTPNLVQDNQQMEKEVVTDVTK